MIAQLQDAPARKMVGAAPLHVGIAEELDVKMPPLICKMKKNKKWISKTRTSYEISLNTLVNKDKKM